MRDDSRYRVVGKELFDKLSVLVDTELYAVPRHELVNFICCRYRHLHSDYSLSGEKKSNGAH